MRRLPKSGIESPWWQDWEQSNMVGQMTCKGLSPKFLFPRSILTFLWTFGDTLHIVSSIQSNHKNEYVWKGERKRAPKLNQSKKI